MPGVKCSLHDKGTLKKIELLENKGILKSKENLKNAKKVCTI